MILYKFLFLKSANNQHIAIIWIWTNNPVIIVISDKLTARRYAALMVMCASVRHLPLMDD